MKKAIDVAKHVINKCCCDNKAISNLQLQKILYYLQGAHLARFGVPLFDDKVSAWKFGPVVSSVYYTYNRYGAAKIYEQYDEIFDYRSFDLEQKTLIDKIIEEKRELSVWQLVEMTHNEEPWAKAYARGIDNISQESMRDFFMNEGI